MCSSEYKSNNFSNNNIDSDDGSDQKFSFAELQEHNQSQSSNNSPQIKLSKKIGMNRKAYNKVKYPKFALIRHDTKLKK